MDKKIYGFYLKLIILVSAAVLLTLFLGEEKRTNPLEDTSIEVLKPIAVKNGEDGTGRYSLQFRSGDPIRDCLMFLSVHQRVKVLVNDEVIYEMEPSGKFGGSTTGSVWNYVIIPQTTDTVIVETERIYPDTGQFDIVFYQGNSYAMEWKSIRDSLPETFLCVMDMIIGIILVGYWNMFKKNRGIRKDMLYLGTFAVFVGIWTFVETNYALMIFRNHAAISLSAFVCLMMAVTPFVLFARSYNGLKEKWISGLLCAAAMLNTVTVLTLHFLNIISVKESIISTHILMGLAGVYQLMAQGFSLWKNGMTRKNRMTFLASVFLLGSAAIDFWVYYGTTGVFTFASRTGVLVFVCVIGYVVIEDSFRQMEEGRKAAFYKELAVTDILTKLGNRTAYEQWENSCGDFNKTAIINMDLNNLKLCNDTLGHSCGDQYIADAAQIIREVFGSVGSCYRIGGDEFCAIIADADKDKVQMLLQKLENSENEYNQASSRINMKIAAGYAIFDPVTDKSIMDTRVRADSRMYDHKVSMKEKEKE